MRAYELLCMQEQGKGCGSRFFIRQSTYEFCEIKQTVAYLVSCHSPGQVTVVFNYVRVLVKQVFVRT